MLPCGIELTFSMRGEPVDSPGELASGGSAGWERAPGGAGDPTRDRAPTRPAGGDRPCSGPTRSPFPSACPTRLLAEALRLLDASREAINQLLVDLWPDLDRFAAASRRWTGVPGCAANTPRVCG